MAGDAPLQCPPEQPPRILSRDVTAEDLQPQALTFPADGLVLTETAEGWSVSWDSRTHFQRLLPDDSKVMVSAVVAEKPTLPLGPYMLQLRYTTTSTSTSTSTSTAHYHRRRCEVTLDMDATLQVGDLVLESTGQTSWKNAQPCGD